MRSASSAIKEYNTRALCEALAQGRIGAVRRSAKNMPMCVFIASIGGEECRFALLPALSRLLPTVSSCVRAYRRYVHLRIMRSLILQVAHTLAVSPDERRQYLDILVDHEERESRKRKKNMARFEKLTQAINM